MADEKQGTPTPAPTAPAAAPTPAPAGADKIEATLPDPKAAPVEEAAESTGDAGLDLALSQISKAGVPRSHPAVRHALETGDFDLVKAALADKGATGLDTYLKVAAQSLERAKSAASEAKEKTKEAIFSVAGSADAWAKARDWASKEATPEEREGLNAALQAGPVQAKMAARYVMDAYNRKHGNAPAEGGKPKSALKPDAVAGAQPSGDRLSAAQFARESGRLLAQFGSRAQSTPEYQALLARRG